MKARYAFVSAMLLCLPLQAQITFWSSNLLTQAGQYSRAYICTNANPSTLIGPPGGPQRWDFSQPQQAGETIRRMDIVPPTDGGHGSYFPAATYAERYTDQDDGDQEWDFYSIATNLGQRYYGYYNGPLGGTVVFTNPAVVIPTSLGFGTNWTYSLVQITALVEVDLTASATVDAYGTVVLPQIGEFQALRVNQLTSNRAWYGPFPLASYYFREYYWLVPGLGKALQIISLNSNTPPSSTLTSVYEIRRVFEASSVTNSGGLSPMAGLQILVESSLATLSWQAAANASGYLVEGLPTLDSTDWQLLGSPTTNSWSESLTTTQRFYRVFSRP
jgi:hypothetical protein